MDRERMYSLIPLSSRLDRIDNIMKRLEGKHINGRRSSDITSLDLAGCDDYFKGSLVDRVSTLEYRLFQLSLEMESNSSARTSTITSRTTESSSIQCSRKPNLGTTFDTVIKNQTVEESQPKMTRSTQKMMNKAAAAAEQKAKKSTKGQAGKGKDKEGTREEDRDSKNKIQHKPRGLPYLKLLGC